MEYSHPQVTCFTGIQPKPIHMMTLQLHHRRLQIPINYRVLLVQIRQPIQDEVLHLVPVAILVICNPRIVMEVSLGIVVICRHQRPLVEQRPVLSLVLRT